MSTILGPRARRLAGLGAASVLLLTGCGLPGADVHPGAAAQVGDDTISMKHVDEVTDDYCTALTDQLAQNNTVLPRRYLRQYVAGLLANEAVARQLADQYDVEPGAAYDQAVADLRKSVVALPTSARDAVLEVQSASDYVTAIVQAVGAQVLQQRGTARPSAKAATAAGQRAQAAWIRDHDVTIDPSFGVEFQDGRAVPSDNGLSYAVGKTAKDASAADPNQAYAGALPVSQRCGGGA